MKSKKQTRKPYVWCIIFTEAVGVLSALLTKDGIRVFNMAAKKPPLMPPSAVFPIAWTILFALMGVSIARIYTERYSKRRTDSIKVFLIQLAFNFLWSIIFFNIRNYAFAFIWILALWLLIVMMIVSFYRVDRSASKLQIPYLLWVTFAAYLNYAVWMLNT